jgi:DNA polymerase-3 subunit epsilon
MGGVSTRPEDTVLTDRALGFLRAGPADASSLISHVCNLPGAPKLVAEHIAAALFAGRREFIKDTEGRWLLTGSTTLSDDAALISTVSLPEVSTTPATRRPRLREQAKPYTLDPKPSDTEFRPHTGTEQRTATLLREMSFVVVDTETTGGSPWFGHRITEYAAVTVQNGEITDVYETLVNPERPIPPWVTRLTRITMDMVKHAPRFRDVGHRVVQSLEGKVFVAHNATFDWRFITTEVLRATGQQLEGPRLCTVRLARKLCAHLPSRSLGSLANYYGIENKARHRAGGDAMATAHVLLKLLHEARGRGCESWDDLQRLVNARGKGKKRRRRPPASPRSTKYDTSA